MSRPRLPQAVAEATGAAMKNPQRFRDRKQPESKPLGKPSKLLTGDECSFWDSFRAEMPWLTEADRTVVETAAKLRCRVMTDPECPIAAITQLRLCLQAMGGTPTTRTKVGAPDEDDDDPADQYFN